MKIYLTSDKVINIEDDVNEPILVITDKVNNTYTKIKRLVKNEKEILYMIPTKNILYIDFENEKYNWE